MTDNPPNPYEVLGVTASSSTQEIMRAYADAVKKRAYPNAVLAQALAVLRNENMRAELDLLLHMPQAPSIGPQFRASILSELTDQLQSSKTGVSPADMVIWPSEDVVQDEATPFPSGFVMPQFPLDLFDVLLPIPLPVWEDMK